MIKNKTLEANIAVHSALANAGEYDKSPHFRIENKSKVEKLLRDLIEKSPNPHCCKLLDLGCGTGFVLHLASPYVEHAFGVDITEDMMALVDLSLGNITLKTAIAEDTGYEDNSFDVVTAYSFLDHLEDYSTVMREAYRVLGQGGIFYSDLNPNRDFSLMLEGLETEHDEPQSLPHAISREVTGMLHNGSYYQENFGVDQKTLTDAEPQKSFNKGFDAREVEALAKEIGFSRVEIHFDWFLGQGVLKNENSSINLLDVDDYLRQMLPATKSLFKYLRFVFVK